MPKNNKQTVWVGLGFLIVGLVLGLVINNRTVLFDTKTVQGVEEEEFALNVEELPSVSVSMDDDPVMGDPNAPITMVEFSDYQCPYCARFYAESFQTLKKEYIDTGIVKLVYRDFPLPSHSRAGLAAQSAECVRAAGSSEGGLVTADERYFQMHDLLFENQSSWVAAEDLKATLVTLAQEKLGVNIASCLDTAQMKAEVEADYTAGRSYGVSGTPTFFINGKKLVGAWPYVDFQQVLESVR